MHRRRLHFPLPSQPPAPQPPQQQPQPQPTSPSPAPALSLRVASPSARSTLRFQQLPPSTWLAPKAAHGALRRLLVVGDRRRRIKTLQQLPPQGEDCSPAASALLLLQMNTEQQRTHRQ